jgi:GST-like protein
MTDYIPPKVWTWDQTAANGFTTNRPIAGPTHDAPLPRGQHPFQLYSLATPNGQKVTILFEELLEAGFKEADYDAWLINIGTGEQFGSGFTEVNPNSKIPALWDYSGPEPIRLFESGSILVHLAEKFGAFLAPAGAERAETFNWLMWQMGAAPFLGGGFGHFYAYAPLKIEYAINRYTMETKRLLDVLERRLAEVPYVAGNAYTIADMAIWPWFGGLVLGRAYEAAEFLDVAAYPNVIAWAEKIDARPAVKRGRMVNRGQGTPESQVRERHSAADFIGKSI